MSATVAIAPDPRRGRPLRATALGVLFAFALAGLAGIPFGVAAQEGVDQGVRGQVRPPSKLAQFLPADVVEKKASEHYRKTLQEASQASRLAPDNHAQVLRLRSIAARIIPFAAEWNPRATSWQWEVNVIAENQLNAWCAAGGKIVFYTRILRDLQLSDSEVAVIMGHEVAHALREHTRKRMAEGLAANMGVGVIGSVLGVREMGHKALNYGAQLVTLKFGRTEELEADLIGLELAARAGYDPSVGVPLWQKMTEAGGASGPEYKSTHPSGERRIRQIQEMLPRVQGIYQRADKPSRVYGPPPRT